MKNLFERYIMKNLLERLTDEARQDLEQIKNDYPQSYELIHSEFNLKNSYLDLKYITILNLQNFGIAKGQSMLNIDLLFDK
jgi:hypothetical protein